MSLWTHIEPWRITAARFGLPVDLVGGLPRGLDPSRCEITTLGALDDVEARYSLDGLPPETPVIMLPGWRADDATELRSVVELGRVIQGRARA